MTRLELARDNFGYWLLKWVEAPSDRNRYQLGAAAAAYQMARRT